ncbi:hypothetical protein GY03_09140 [Proteus vulgaris]|nr:hypothetical protein [Proteus vulgaris]
MLVSAYGYGIFVYIMAAIPLSMKQNGFEFATIAFYLIGWRNTNLISIAISIIILLIAIKRRKFLSVATQ